MARVFFALQPDPPSLAGLRRIQQDALPRSAALRLVSPRSIHLTLAFLGERSEDDIAALIDAASPITLAPMTQPITGWLWLPSVERPRVLALGVAADAALESLAEQLWHVLDQLGLRRPERALLPHVSLARMRGNIVPGTLESPPIFDLGWAALGLFASRLTPAGPRYQALWSVASGQSSGQT